MAWMAEAEEFYIKKTFLFAIVYMEIGDAL